MVWVISQMQTKGTELGRLQREREEVITNLSKGDTKTASLKRELQEFERKYNEPLTQKNEIEKEINRIISSDPANLSLKAKKLRQQLQGANIDQIQERVQLVNKELQGVAQKREHSESKINSLKNEIGKCCSQRLETGKGLRELEMADPANVKVKLGVLRNRWRELNQTQLERICTVGQVELLLKEQHLLNFRIENGNRELENLQKKKEDMGAAEDTLLLERLILQQELSIEDLRKHEPRLFEIHYEMKQLELERARLSAQENRIQQELDKVRTVRTRLNVRKELLLSLVLATIVLLVLYLLPIQSARVQSG
jgi:hypothetical protein